MSNKIIAIEARVSDPALIGGVAQVIMTLADGLSPTPGGRGGVCIYWHGRHGKMARQARFRSMPPAHCTETPQGTPALLASRANVAERP